MGIALAVAAVIALFVPAAMANGEPDDGRADAVVEERRERGDVESQAARPGGEVLPVLPLGAGLACLGLGIGALGLRLRNS
ncbi:hypothetical protein DEH69_27285 [Streptomyces sp. PT12]|nr:hypothetical protein DEH69_27285 [Streptomyces sp. PT12]